MQERIGSALLRAAPGLTVRPRYVALLLILLLAVSIFAVRHLSNVPIENLGFHLLDEDVAPRFSEGSWRSPPLSISGDRRCLAVRGRLEGQPAGGESTLFFDLRRKSFVARYDGVVEGGWRSDRLPVMKAGYEKFTRLRLLLNKWLKWPLPTLARYRYYRVNVPAGKALLLHTRKTRSLTNGSEYPNRRSTAVVRIEQNANMMLKGAPGELQILDLRRWRAGRRHRVTAGQLRVHPDSPLKVVGWLDDDRTFVVSAHEPGNAYTTICLVDAFGKAPVRRIPVGEKFEKFRAEGAFGANLNGLMCEPQRIIADCRLRFHVTRIMATGPSSGIAAGWSLCDLDLGTGELSYAMDLGWTRGNGPHWQDRIESPGGRSILGVTARRHEMRGPLREPNPVITWKMEAVIHKGRSSRTLPLWLPVPESLRAITPPPAPVTIMGLPQVGSEAMPLNIRIAFLDEDTLIYIGDGDSICRFDLRTDKTEVLWGPGEAQKQPPR